MRHNRHPSQKPIAPKLLHKEATRTLKLALREDASNRDRTSRAVFTKHQAGVMAIKASSKLVLAGGWLIPKGFKLLDTKSHTTLYAKEGETLAPNKTIARIEGRLGSLMAAERSVLNLVQFMCSIATITHSCCELLPPKVALLATRKTVAGLRVLSKYAVVVGGGEPYRLHLADGILVKDNHLLEGAKTAVDKIRQRGDAPITLECDSLKQVSEASGLNIQRILLDNMSLANMKKAVALVKKQAPHIQLEASGNIQMKDLPAIAKTGVNAVSMGMITQNPPRVDITAEIVAK